MPGPVAGTRKKHRRARFPTRLVVVLVVLALIGGAGWYFRGPLGGLLDSVVDRVAGRSAVLPGAPTASSESEGQPAALASDGYNNTFWAPGPLGEDAVGETITFPFSEPFRLARVALITGASPDEGERRQDSWPTSVQLTMTTPAGVDTAEATLEATGEVQWVTVGVDDVTAVKVTILGAFGENPQGRVAIAEVAFQGR